jgi:hypothetical protein
MSGTRRAAIYVRVSTLEQSTDSQESELREYTERRGWSCTVYRDKGQSGAKNDRPALNTLLADLRKRSVDGGGLGAGSAGEVVEATAGDLRGVQAARCGFGVAETERRYDTARWKVDFSSARSRRRVRKRNAAGQGQSRNGASA